jgi:hypothetical protein
MAKTEPKIDMKRIASVQKKASWADLESVVALLEQKGTITAGQRKLTDQQIAFIDGQRTINGGILAAINRILDSLATLQASVGATAQGPGKTKTGPKGKTAPSAGIEAIRADLADLLGKVPPGCKSSGSGGG